MNACVERTFFLMYAVSKDSWGYLLRGFFRDIVQSFRGRSIRTCRSVKWTFFFLRASLKSGFRSSAPIVLPFPCVRARACLAGWLIRSPPFLLPHLLVINSTPFLRNGLSLCHTVVVLIDFSQLEDWMDFSREQCLSFTHFLSCLKECFLRTPVRLVSSVNIDQTGETSLLSHCTRKDVRTGRLQVCHVTDLILNRRRRRHPRARRARSPLGRRPSSGWPRRRCSTRWRRWRTPWPGRSGPPCGARTSRHRTLSSPGMKGQFVFHVIQKSSYMHGLTQSVNVSLDKIPES